MGIDRAVRDTGDQRQHAIRASGGREGGGVGRVHGHHVSPAALSRNILARFWMRVCYQWEHGLHTSSSCNQCEHARAGNKGVPLGLSGPFRCPGR